MHGQGCEGYDNMFLGSKTDSFFLGYCQEYCFKDQGSVTLQLYLVIFDYLQDGFCMICIPVSFDAAFYWCVRALFKLEYKGRKVNTQLAWEWSGSYMTNRPNLLR